MDRARLMIPSMESPLRTLSACNDQRASLPVRPASGTFAPLSSHFWMLFTSAFDNRSPVGGIRSSSESVVIRLMSVLAPVSREERIALDAIYFRIPAVDEKSMPATEFVCPWQVAHRVTSIGRTRSSKWLLLCANAGFTCKQIAETMNAARDTGSVASRFMVSSFIP